jgi:hypothetical protein
MVLLIYIYIYIYIYIFFSSFHDFVEFFFFFPFMVRCLSCILPDWIVPLHFLMNSIYLSIKRKVFCSVSIFQTVCFYV